jgi:hypothetical protein
MENSGWRVSTHVYLVNSVPAGEVVHDARLVEVRQLGHVVHSGRRRLRVLGVDAAQACYNLNQTNEFHMVIQTCKPITVNINDIWD